MNADAPVVDLPFRALLPRTKQALMVIFSGRPWGLLFVRYLLNSVWPDPGVVPDEK